MITIGICFILLLFGLGGVGYVVGRQRASLQTVFIRLSGLPVILLLIPLVLDKLGRSSMILFVPLILSWMASGILLLFGLGLRCYALKRKERIGKLIVATLLSGLPLALFLVWGHI